MGKKTILLTLFITMKFVLQYALCNSGYDLHRDEYLHLDLGNHLEWGYLSVPPVIAWLSYIIRLLGNTVFWVRFFPALFGALTIIVVWHTIKELKGGLFALTITATGLVFSSLLRMNMLFQPNSFDILAWTFVCFALVKFLNNNQNKWLYIMAVGLGIGFLNKYNIVFLATGLILGLALTPQRKVFTNKHLYFAALLTLAIISPNLIWQYNNHFPVVHHMAELSETQLENVNRADFIKEQLLFFIGSLYIIIAALIALVKHPPFKKYKLFFVSFIVIFAVFIALKAKGYYAIGLYPVYFAFGAVYLEQVLVSRGRFLKAVLYVLPLAFFALIFRLAYPIYAPEDIAKVSNKFKKYGLSRWEDGKDHELPQDFADMLGWHEMAAIAGKAYNSVSKTGYTIVLCDNYGQAGAINYYARDKTINAIALHADYVNWIDLDKPIVNIILFQVASDDDKERKREKQLFESVSCVGEIKNPLARENGTRIYLLKNATTDINAILSAEISDESKRWAY